MKTKIQNGSVTNRVAELAKSNGGSAIIPERKEVIPAQAVTIPKLIVKTIHVPIICVSPLIVHSWSQKAIYWMLGKQLGEASPGRPKKSPIDDFKGSLYYLPDKKGFGIPAPAFKAAMVTSANDVDLKMTECKRAIHVNHYLVPIISDPLAKEDYTEWDLKYEKQLEFEHKHGCSMRMDMVRLESGVADIRFRGSWPKWKANLEIQFNESVLSADQVVGLVSAAGFGSGVCEWRPSSPNVKSGEYGRFQVEIGK